MGADATMTPTTKRRTGRVNPKSFPRGGSGNDDEVAFAPRVVVLVLCVAWWILVVRHIQTTLENHLVLTHHRGGGTTLRDDDADAMFSKNAPAPYDKYLIFAGHDDKGQGEGNLLTGLLASHLLGCEFDRIVCVPHSWTAFRSAFVPKYYLKECDEILKIDDGTDRRLRKRYTLRSWNFGGATSSECVLRKRLSSNERMLRLGGNTYPKWTDVPYNWFDLLYEPTDALRSILPWKKKQKGGGGRLRRPPRIVVHLRMGDDKSDRRKGLDDETMECLGKSLPNNDDTFLVTNNVDWYDLFSSKYGWSNPGWKAVKHSAPSKMLQWGAGGGGGASLSLRRHGEKAEVPPEEEESKDLNSLQLYADWYTLLRAEIVYHTASDFSSSAVHWRGMESKIIMGVAQRRGGTDSEGGKDACELELIEEAWRRDGTELPLKYRRWEDLTDQDGNECWE